MLEESALCKALTKCFPGMVIFKPFGWSGRNTFAARLKAAQLLHTQLQTQLEQYPGCKHVVIGHSHGGSIALEAVFQSALKDSMEAVICLSTPFLRMRARGIAQPFADVWPTTAVLTLSATPLALGILLDACGISGRLLLSDTWLRIVLLFAILLQGLGIVLLYKGWKAINKPNQLLTGLVNDTYTKLFILRTVADEASSLLVAAHFSSWLMRAIALRPWRLATLPFRWRWVQRYRASLEHFTLWIGDHMYSIGAATIAALWVIVAVLYFGYQLPFSDSFWLAALFFVGAVIGIVYFIHIVGFITLSPLIVITGTVGILALMIWPLLLAICIVALLPFGWDIGFSAIWYEVSAEDIPASIHVSDFVLLEVPADDFLNHSRIYDDPRAGSQLAEWLSCL